MKLESKYKTFPSFENVICKMAAILFWEGWVDEFPDRDSIAQLLIDQSYANFFSWENTKTYFYNFSTLAWHNNWNPCSCRTGKHLSYSQYHDVNENSQKANLANISMMIFQM